MRVRHTKTPLSKDWPKVVEPFNPVYVDEISPTPSSRLRMALCVFRTRLDMRKFWKHGLGVYMRGHSGLGRNCMGVVHNLGFEVYEPPDYDVSFFEVDPKLFSIMGLVKKDLTVEVIVHESVHAAINYASRVQRRAHDIRIDTEDEMICYPAGFIASELVRSLKKGGLI